MPDKYHEKALLDSAVLGWCDSAGCESVGHAANDCRLTRTVAAFGRKCAADAYEDAKNFCPEKFDCDTCRMLDTKAAALRGEP